MDAFNVKRVAGDGKCLFWSLTILLENVECQYDAMRKKTVMHVCDSWNKFKEYVILTRDGS
jgi:hypothetical protein